MDISKAKKSGSQILLVCKQISCCIFFLGVLFFLTGCNDSFEPFEENDRYHFSIYGYLDASADTQWVRITPPRQQLETQATIPEMSVTITNIETGKTFAMNDSLFQEGGANFFNFWTSERIENNQTYRLEAEGPSGEKSQVTVEVPGELPTPLVIIQTSYGQPTTYLVVVDDDINVVDVQSKYYVRVKTPSQYFRHVYSFTYRNTAETTEAYGGGYTYLLEPEKELEEIERKVLLPVDGEIEVVYRQIFVASSATEWSSVIESLDDITYALPETFSNIENGVGFLTGIDSKIVPYASCVNEEETALIPCPEEEAYW